MKKARIIYHYIFYCLLVTRVKSELNLSFQFSMQTEKKQRLWVCACTNNRTVDSFAILK